MEACLDYNDQLRSQILQSVCFGKYQPVFSWDHGHALVSKGYPPSDWDRTWRQYHLRLKQIGFEYDQDQHAIYHYVPLTEHELPALDTIRLVDGDKLLAYQNDHAKRLVRSLKTFQAAFDGSDTGVGKTFTACCVAKTLQLSLFVVCPKAVIPAWQHAITYFGCKVVSVTNYELLRKGKYLRRDANGIIQKAPCNFLIAEESDNPAQHFKWTLSKQVLVVFDEAQRCKDSRTLNSALLVSARHSGMNLLLLSATLATKPDEMRAAAFALGLYPRYADFPYWLNTMKEKIGIDLTKRLSETVLQQRLMQLVHQQLFPLHGSRLKIAELGDQFPACTILADPLDMGDNTEKINHQYTHLIDRIRELRTEGAKTIHILTAILKARQEIELLKVPTMVEMATDIIESDNACVIFVNFDDTLNALKAALKTECIIRGGQSAEIRQRNIDAFTTHQSPIIIANIKAGGLGINLHDPITQKQRIALISPSFSATDFKQAIGRVQRANGGYSVNRILFCAGTVEESICQSIRQKIQNIDILHDGDFRDWFPTLPTEKDDQ